MPVGTVLIGQHLKIQQKRLVRTPLGVSGLCHLISWAANALGNLGPIGTGIGNRPGRAKPKQSAHGE